MKLYHVDSENNTERVTSLWYYNTEASNGCKVLVQRQERLQNATPRDDAICFCFDLISGCLQIPEGLFYLPYGQHHPNCLIVHPGH